MNAKQSDERRRRFLLGSVRRSLGLMAAAGTGARTATADGAAPDVPMPVTRHRPPHVVVVGGGFGGATAARFLRERGGDGVRVTLVERDASFVSCPMSNLVLSGDRDIASLTRSREPLRTVGVHVVQDTVTAIDGTQRRVRLAHGDDLVYDRLVVAPGIDFMDGEPGTMAMGGSVLHAWKAGPQIVQLREQIERMPNGGTFVITIPRVPYRSPAAPYERACTVASFFQRSRMRSKVLVLDANDGVTSMKELFTRVWKDQYPTIVEYRSTATLRAVDAGARTVQIEGETIRADVLNVIAPQRAADIAWRAGLANVDGRWCGIDWQTMESTAVPGVHVLGDACVTVPAMAKSAGMANQQAKVVATAILALLDGRAAPSPPTMTDVSYSWVDPVKAARLTTVHRWDAVARVFVPDTDAGSVSPKASPADGALAQSAMQALWAEAIG